MKKLISVILTICSLCLVTSCNSDSDWLKAEHTYSLLGFTVSYNYPNGYNAVGDEGTVLLRRGDGSLGSSIFLRRGDGSLGSSIFLKIFRNLRYPQIRTENRPLS